MTSLMHRLANKVGIITASGSGMGRAGAILFASEGASVLVVDANKDAADKTVEMIRAAGGQAQVSAGDLCDEAYARDIVEEAVKHFGRLDFVWNHVGHPGPAGLEEVSTSDLDLALNLNLRSVLFTTAAALPMLRKGGGGNILFTASTSGLEGSKYSPVYSAAKFGVIGMARSLAKAHAAENIRVNVICPGATNTPMLRTFVRRPGQEGDLPGDLEKLVAQRSSLSPMGRAAEPVEIARAALFLVSDDASYVTGVALAVDGGATA